MSIKISRLNCFFRVEVAASGCAHPDGDQGTGTCKMTVRRRKLCSVSAQAPNKGVIRIESAGAPVASGQNIDARVAPRSRIALPKYANCTAPPAACGRGLANRGGARRRERRSGVSLAKLFIPGIHPPRTDKRGSGHGRKDTSSLIEAKQGRDLRPVAPHGNEACEQKKRARKEKPSCEFTAGFGSFRLYGRAYAA
jgi:hypothetical protein